MKISISKILSWSAFIATLYFFFYQHIVTGFGGKYCYPFLFIVIAMSIVIILTLKRGFTVLELMWILILFISTLTNVGLAKHSYLWPLTFIMLILLVLALAKDVGWHETFVKVILVCSFIYCAATIILYFIPSIYQEIVSFWGYYPNGTEKGVFGYRAGIADNHSANGTYCVIAFLIVCATLISTKFEDKNGKRKFIFFTLLSAVSVLLTTKRAHLLFGFFAVLVCYYFFSEKKKTGRLFKVFFFACVVLVIFQFAASYIPAIADFLEGFEETDLSNGRFEFWIIALNYFKSNPMLGIGWLGFRFATKGLYSTSGYVDVHNVYIQLLAESGVLGFVVMLIIFIGTLWKTVTMQKRYSSVLEAKQLKMLAISTTLQVFCLVYGFTGNFLYDRTCFIYIFACALSYSLERLLKSKAEQMKKLKEND